MVQKHILLIAIGDTIFQTTSASEHRHQMGQWVLTSYVYKMNDSLLPRSPPPAATWSLNGMSLPPFPADMELSDDVRQGLGSGGQLSINAYPPPSNTLGEYMCNLTISGQDSSRSILGKIYLSLCIATFSVDGILIGCYMVMVFTVALSDISSSAAISGRA